MDFIKYRRYNKLIVGAISGMLLPAIGYVFLFILYTNMEELGWINPEGFSENFRYRTIGLLSICLNAVLLHWFKRRYMIHAMRGVVFPTMIYIVAWLIIYGRSVL